MRINTKYLLLLSSIILLTSCSYDSNIIDQKKVSLMEYIDKTDLERYGFSADDIEKLNSEIKSSDTFAENYISYETNGFTILSSNEHPSQIFVIENKKFIASFDNKARTLYSKDTNIPTRLDALVTYVPENPSLSYDNNEYSYYDLNTNGIDITYEKMPNKDKNYDYLSTEILGTPNVNIIEAKINGKECEALAGSFACCLSSQGSYDAYKFNYEDGWISIPTNKKLNTICNDKDFKTAKNKLKSELFPE